MFIIGTSASQSRREPAGAAKCRPEDNNKRQELRHVCCDYGFMALQWLAQWAHQVNIEGIHKSVEAFYLCFYLYHYFNPDISHSRYRKRNMTKKSYMTYPKAQTQSWDPAWWSGLCYSKVLPFSLFPAISLYFQKLVSEWKSFLQDRPVCTNTTGYNEGVSGELQTQEIERQNSLGMTLFDRVD